MQPHLFTIGHSTHSIEQFLELLTQHRIQVLVDIRRFPGSRRYPHFSRESLGSTLREARIEYCWLEALGGRRDSEGDSSSVNLGLRNESFRNYADYMLTGGFQKGIEQLFEIADSKRTAFMCSEAVFWRCHRRLVSDYLLMKGIRVQHIMPSGDLHPHELTDVGRIDGDHLTYPGPKSGQRQLPFE